MTSTVTDVGKDQDLVISTSPIFALPDLYSPTQDQPEKAEQTPQTGRTAFSLPISNMPLLLTAKQGIPNVSSFLYYKAFLFPICVGISAKCKSGG